jgi:hypothetical protein
MTQADNDYNLVKKHTAQLMEHFDTVQIFVTKHEPNAGTINCQLGMGNWYARYGLIKAWCKREERRFELEIKEDDMERNE